jgi:hypothetical protein
VVTIATCGGCGILLDPEGKSHRSVGIHRSVYGSEYTAWINGVLCPVCRAFTVTSGDADMISNAEIMKSMKDTDKTDEVKSVCRRME